MIDICTIFRHDVIPVVYGARPEDYAKVAPPHSYIHVVDFASPQDLAEYLKLLDKNDTLYNEYFKWKESGDFKHTKFICRLCVMAHEAHTANKTMYYEDLHHWWSDGMCFSPQNSDHWTSWMATSHNS